MGKILDKFISTMPKLQARSIEKELLRQENRILYSSPQQFREEFVRRLTSLLESDYNAQFAAYPILDGERRSSELFNYMFRIIGGDLETLFTEADLIAELSDLQTRIYEQDIIFRLSAALAEAETEVELLELLLSNTAGLKDAVIENFRTGSNSLTRNHPLASFLYIDPKTNHQYGPASEMVVDVSVGGLTLPIDIRKAHHPTAIKEITTRDIRDNDQQFVLPGSVTPSTPSNRIVTGEISNLIDGQYDTTFVRMFTVNQLVSGGAKMTLLLDLGRPRTANYITIDPANEYNQKLTELYYVDSLAKVYAINLPTDGVSLADKAMVHFNPVETQSLVLVFKQENDVLVPELNAGNVQKYRYTFGLDNISVGETSYLKEGVYVSRTLSADKISKLHLKTTQNTNIGLDENEAELDPITSPLPTLEYWVHFREIDDSNNIVSQLLPIAPVGMETIREKIYIQHNGKARLNFTVDHEMADDDASLRLYRDGTLVLRDADYTIDVPGVVTIGSILTVDRGFQEEHEYIAEYIPWHQDQTKIPFTDATELVRYNPDNTIDITRPASSRAVRSEANLIIIMRGTGTDEMTSILDKYVFSVG